MSPDKEYKILGFIPLFKKSCPENYEMLKERVFVTVFQPAGGWLGDDIKSKYHLTGKGFFAEGSSELEPRELEQALREDAKLLAEDGIYVIVQGPRQRIRPLREMG